jgi:hypothetical protein
MSRVGALKRLLPVRRYASMPVSRWAGGPVGRVASHTHTVTANRHTGSPAHRLTALSLGAPAER